MWCLCFVFGGHFDCSEMECECSLTLQTCRCLRMLNIFLPLSAIFTFLLLRIICLVHWSMYWLDNLDIDIGFFSYNMYINSVSGIELTRNSLFLYMVFPLCCLFPLLCSSTVLENPICQLCLLSTWSSCQNFLSTPRLYSYMISPFQASSFKLESLPLRSLWQT